MTKRQMLGLIFKRVPFSEYFITCRFFLLLIHFFMRKSNLDFLVVLSKMEYIYLIQSGGSKNADASNSFFVINDVVMIVTSSFLLTLFFRGCVGNWGEFQI